MLANYYHQSILSIIPWKNIIILCVAFIYQYLTFACLCLGLQSTYMYACMPVMITNRKVLAFQWSHSFPLCINGRGHCENYHSYRCQQNEIYGIFVWPKFICSKLCWISQWYLHNETGKNGGFCQASEDSKTFGNNKMASQDNVEPIITFSGESFIEILLINHRWIIVCLFLLPASFFYNLWYYIRNIIIFRLNTAPKSHDKKVRKIQKQVRFSRGVNTICFFFMISICSTVNMFKNRLL